MFHPIRFPPLRLATHPYRWNVWRKRRVCQPAAIPPPPVISDSFFYQPDHRGRPTTFIATPTGIYPLINWVSHYFSRSSFDPEVRCQEVSNRFDRYYREGRLNYITTGIINRQPVVCVATEIGGPCTGLLFTLKPNENASQVIQQLFNVRASIPGSLYVSESRQYLDVRHYIQAAKTPQL
ncbi:COP23 domain-containing protein [Leptothermofonsia sp. ETS-13]|uniref:COP23 domain-containing protein n=1 Tax=Leptothermofonsia sp. ETS-13 TaxID=3035696 RepID=UPI003B9FF889